MEIILDPLFLFNKARGGSRTSPRRERQSLGGRLPNILIIFSEKSYEIKEILVRGGGGEALGSRYPITATESHVVISPSFQLSGSATVWRNWCL